MMIKKVEMQFRKIEQRQQLTVDLIIIYSNFNIKAK
jgi:hypothetical protein